MSKLIGFWSEDERKGAMTTIGGGMLLNRVFSRCSIPGRSLHSHMQIGESRKKPGRHTFITLQQEEQLLSRIFYLGDVGVPVTPH
jgi:hypothetical protein